MPGRTFAIGDIHGELEHLRALLGRMPTLEPDDTVVFLGDYLDRGPNSEEVVRVVRALHRTCGAKVVCLRGNHEDAWLRVVDKGFPEFVFPPQNGCLPTYRSYVNGPNPNKGDMPLEHELEALFSGRFFPEDILAWMRELPFWYEDEHAIYVHAGLVEAKDGSFMHPSVAEPKLAMLWVRTERFFREYRGKKVVVGHTATDILPQELSTWTPEDPTDLWAGPDVIAADTGCGSGGFLTAVELPAMKVYESR
jgi:serine/threonine protein phosphatase 1